MSSNLFLLNDVISYNNYTDDILEQKILENEKRFETIENSNILNNEINKKKVQIVSQRLLTDSNRTKNNHINKKNLLINNKNFVKKKIKGNITPNVRKKNIMEKDNLLLNNYINTYNNILNSNNSKSFTCINSDKKEKRNDNKNIKTKNKILNIKNKKFKNINIPNNIIDCDENLYHQYITLNINNNKHTNYSAQKRTNNNSNDKNISQDNFSKTYQRFLDNQKKQKDKLENIKKIQEKKEKEIYSYKPKINKKSKEIVSHNKEDFYTRQKKLMEEQKKKDALLKEKIRKSEEEKINKDNILLESKINKKNGMKDILTKNKNKNVNETINKLYEWDIRRKDKINKKREEKKNENSFNFHPEINKYSNIFMMKKSQKIVNKSNYNDASVKKQKYIETLTPNNKSSISFNNISFNDGNSLVKEKIKSKEKNVGDLDFKINEIIRKHLFDKDYKNKKNYLKRKEKEKNNGNKSCQNKNNSKIILNKNIIGNKFQLN